MSTRPETLDDMVGQDEVKTVIRTLVKSSIIDNKPIPHIVWSGPSGTGKTTAAKATAQLRNVKLHNINASIISDEKDLKILIGEIKVNEILFIDEIHALKKRVCEFLYSVMEDFEYQDKVHGKIKTIKLPQFTILGATTDFGLLPEPLRMRFKFKAVFKEYTEEELIDIVHFICKNYGFKLSKNIASIIAKTCRNTPRIVVNRTEWIRSYMIANKIKSIKKEDVINVIKLQGVDEHGLDTTDRQYLKILQEFSPISLTQISSKMRISRETIQRDIEPHLIKLGLVFITSSGREINYG